MAYKPIRMDILNQINDLQSKGNGIKKIAKTLNISRNTVRKYLKKIKELTNVNQQPLTGEHLKEIYSKHYVHCTEKKQKLLEALPPLISKLAKVGVTREHIYEDYIEAHPDGYSYGEFCRQIKAYKNIHSSTLHFDHKPAEVMQVDFAGKKLSYYDKDTGKYIAVPVLICTLPCSGKLFVIALPSQSTFDFLYGITQALNYFGGSPKMILSDNLKSYVSKSDRYCPSFTDLSVQLSAHYGLVLDSTRVARPKDKASVERHVTIAYQNIYAFLHQEKPNNIDELNSFILVHLNNLNDKKRDNGKRASRNEYFDLHEKEYLKKLPSAPFDLSKTTRAKIQRNYHVLLGEDNHYYSVPYKYIGQQADVIYTKSTVEIYIGINRIAFHNRSPDKGFTTNEEHRPEKHNQYISYLNNTPQSYIDKATLIGKNTQWAMTFIIDKDPDSPKISKLAEGLLSIARSISNERLEQICTYIKPCGVVSLEMIRNVLASNIDQANISDSKVFVIPIHENIRGSAQYK
jgi:transposase